MYTLSSQIVEHEKPGPFEMLYTVLLEEPAPDQSFQPICISIQNGESGKIPERDYEVSWSPPALPGGPIQFVDGVEMGRVTGIRPSQNRSIRGLN